MQKLKMVMMAMCVLHMSWAEEKQIKLEDIESDTLVHETQRSGPEQKELSSQSTQHIQLSYSNEPQDIFVTPMPRGYSSKGENVLFIIPHFLLPQNLSF
jgi:hypothetical protein